MEKYGILNIENTLEDIWYEASNVWKDSTKNNFEQNEISKLKNSVSEIKECVCLIINAEEDFIELQKKAEKLIRSYKEEDESKKSYNL